MMKHLLLFLVVFIYSLDLGSSLFATNRRSGISNQRSIGSLVSRAFGTRRSGTVPRVSVATNARRLDSFMFNKFGRSRISTHSRGWSTMSGKSAPTEEMHDVLFILDSSGSIGSDEYIKAKQFLADIVTILPSTISRDNTRVAAMTFSEASKIKTEFNFLAHTDKNSVIRAINTISYQNGASTHTTKALEEAKKLFDSSGRPGAHKAIFIATDGRSNGGGSPAVAAATLKNSDRGDVSIVVVAVSNNVNVNEVNSIASSPASEHVYYVSSFTEAKAVSNHAKVMMNTRLQRLNIRRQ